MEKANKSDFIDVYVFKTINEIKNSVSRNIKLDPKREKETDERMAEILRDLINANFKNLQMNPKGDLLYTFLPIVDKQENEKVRLSFVLYYTALYYDNVELLQLMLKEDINFVQSCWQYNLAYLDKSISSKFDSKDYVAYIKRFGYVFMSFAKTIENLPEERREAYIAKFSSLFKVKYEEMIEAANEYRGWNSPLEYLFVKGNLDTFEYNTYRYADPKQLELISFCNGRKYNEETTKRLNHLIQNTSYSNKLHDFDLMMKLYTNEELSTLDIGISRFLSEFSETEEMLQKAIEFVSLRPDLVSRGMCLEKDRFMNTSNYILIEAMDHMEKHWLVQNEHNFTILSKTMAPKVALKRVFGAYKKRD